MPNAELDENRVEEPDNVKYAGNQILRDSKLSIRYSYFRRPIRGNA
jgi:hypothetical protein